MTTTIAHIKTRLHVHSVRKSDGDLQDGKLPDNILSLSAKQRVRACNDEKDFICEQFNRFGDSQRPEVCLSPEEKRLGHSSKKLLKWEDFEPIKTLGTGTFARVWLVRVNDGKKENRDKVFALKKLRKVDGLSRPFSYDMRRY